MILIQNFISTMIDENFKNSTKCWICHNASVNGDVNLRNHYHITGKYRASVHWDCNIIVKLNHKIPIIFHNLKNSDSQFVMQELGKFNFKMSYQMDQKNTWPLTSLIK